MKFNPGDYVSSTSFRGIALQVIGNTKKAAVIPEYCDHEYESYCQYCNGDWEDEYEWAYEDDIYDCVMVGDDQVHAIDEHELKHLPPDLFCGSCGQIGCGWH